MVTAPSRYTLHLYRFCIICHLLPTTHPIYHHHLQYLTLPLPYMHTCTLHTLPHVSKKGGGGGENTLRRK